MDQNHIRKITALLLTAALICGLFWMGASLTYNAVPELPSVPREEIQLESSQADDVPKETTEPTVPEDTADPQEETQPPTESQPSAETHPPTETQPPAETQSPVAPLPPQVPEAGSNAPQETAPAETPTDPTVPNDKDPALPDSKPEPGNGETNHGGGGLDVPTEGETDETKLKIVTDLSNCTVTYDTLTDDTLNFYAYLINGGDKVLKVKLRNSTTPQNGTYLTGSGQNYSAKLARMDLNYFTLYVKQGEKTVHEITYLIRYMPQKADSESPQIGEHPPVIETNLTDGMKTSTRNFTMTVRATDYLGAPIHSSSVEIFMDGKAVGNPTGGPLYEYELYFPDPEIGQETRHNITVTAWDTYGNSAFVSYTVIYEFIDTGDEIGTATIILDATTVGLDRLEDPYTVKIKQGQPASYAVLEMLQDCGYEVKYSGTPDIGFYLKTIIRGGMTDYAQIPDLLWAKIKQDGLNLTGKSSTDSLGEFDYTQGSGWVYSIGGDNYAGKGLSNYYLQDGDTLYLRYTLAYGKDLGATVDGSGSYGALPSYCGKWINGRYYPSHSWDGQQHRQDPTCAEDGCVYEECTVCKEKKVIETIPATGVHSFQIAEQVDPANGADGWILYRCDICGAEKKEVIPWTQGSKDEETASPPEPSNDS